MFKQIHISLQIKELQKRIFSMRNLDIAQEKIEPLEKEIERLEKEAQNWV